MSGYAGLPIPKNKKRRIVMSKELAQNLLKECVALVAGLVVRTEKRLKRRTEIRDEIWSGSTQYADDNIFYPGMTYYLNSI